MLLREYGAHNLLLCRFLKRVYRIFAFYIDGAAINVHANHWIWRVSNRYNIINTISHDVCPRYYLWQFQSVFTNRHSTPSSFHVYEARTPCTCLPFYRRVAISILMSRELHDMRLQVVFVRIEYYNCDVK